MSLPLTDYFIPICQTLNNAQLSLAQRYALLNRIFDDILNEATAQTDANFSGKHARLFYLCEKHHIGKENYLQLNHMRHRLHHASNSPTADLQRYLGTDARLLSQFYAHITAQTLPDYLAQLLPTHIVTPPKRKLHHEKLRAIVLNCVAEGIYVLPALGEDQEFFVRLQHSDPLKNHSQLLPLLKQGSQINLIHPQQNEKGEWECDFVVLEPDYLVDVNNVANCFQAYAHSADLQVYNRLSPVNNNYHLLLGNFASQLLDQSLHHPTASYGESIRQFFDEHALSFVTCPEFQHQHIQEKFHRQAAAQQHCLQYFSTQSLPNELGYPAEQMLLEPSFFCEMLGLQGRMDLLSDDFQCVVEQKSGKAYDETTPLAAPNTTITPRYERKMPHRMQLLLYMAILHYAHKVPYSQLKAALLYSAAAPQQALTNERNVPQLLCEAMQIRNEIVAREFDFSERGAQSYFQDRKATQISASNQRIWTQYVAPRYDAFYRALQTQAPVVQQYFFRFHRFLSLEHRLAKLGTSARSASGFAAAWHNSLDEKEQAGNIITDLSLASEAFVRNAQGAIVEIHLLIAPKHSEQIIETLPNFRVGDIVVLYATPHGQLPDLRNSMVHRATIIRIDKKSLQLRLRAPQTSERVFASGKHQSWCIEPDFMESSYATLYRSLYTFATTSLARRTLLLNESKARIDSSIVPQLTFADEEVNEIVRKAQQARDFFLLMGPPGTGKTSVGLLNILRENLVQKSSKVLLTAFTNRAVDEICSKLVKENIDFVRIGSVQSCAPEYQAYLLSQRSKGYQRLAQLRSMLLSVRVVVGTTTSLAANLAFVEQHRFDLAIVDEASQLLEPQLLPLLMAQHTNNGPVQSCIERFVLIGDHKQLPAVVQQSETESCVHETELHRIGLQNCRYSLFERLLQILPAECTHQLTRQGRMHPELAEIPSRYFYEGKLKDLQLPHQQKGSSSPRIQFYDCPPSEVHELSPKTNQAEAQLIVRLLCQLCEEAQQTGTSLQASDFGIIVPYRHQIALLHSELAHSPYPHLQNITIDTVERFQGSERRIIVYGFTVRQSQQLNFLCSTQFVDPVTHRLIDRKLNVALTRARERNILVGNAQLLCQVPLFAQIIKDIGISKLSSP